MTSGRITRSDQLEALTATLVVGDLEICLWVLDKMLSEARLALPRSTFRDVVQLALREGVLTLPTGFTLEEALTSGMILAVVMGNTHYLQSIESPGDTKATKRLTKGWHWLRPCQILGAKWFVLAADSNWGKNRLYWETWNILQLSDDRVLLICAAAQEPA